MSANFTPIDFLLSPPVGVERSEPILQPAIGEISPIPEQTGEVKKSTSADPDDLSNYIEEKSDIPEIPADVAAAGVTTSGVGQPVLELPLEDVEISEGLKAPVSSGFRWLAEICVYMLKKAHLTLKKIHGKITRVAIK